MHAQCANPQGKKVLSLAASEKKLAELSGSFSCLGKCELTGLLLNIYEMTNRLFGVINSKMENMVFKLVDKWLSFPLNSFISVL